MTPADAELARRNVERRAQAGDRPPLVSVCVVAYNHAAFLPACLDSLVAQDCDVDFEILVGDDASTDGSPGLLRSYAERYPGLVRPILHAANLGATRNYFSVHGQARGRFVAHLDGDDLAYPAKLRRQVDALRSNPDCSFVVHDMDLIARDGAPLGRTASPGLPARADLGYLVAHGAYFQHSSKMYRREATITKESGGRELLDLYAHIEHAASGPIVGLPEALGAYRLGSGFTARPDMDEAILRAQREAIERAAQLGCDPAVVERGRLKVEYRTAMKQLMRGDRAAFRRLIRLRGAEYRSAQWRHAVLSLMRHNRPLLDAYRWALQRRNRPRK